MKRTPQTRSASRPGRARKPVAVNDQTGGAPPQRVRPPLSEQFHVAVDRQIKSGYGTYAAAEEAAAAIKKQHPQLQVTVYDAKERRHTAIEQPKEQPKAPADPQKEIAHRVRGRTSQRRAAAGARR